MSSWERNHWEMGLSSYYLASILFRPKTLLVLLFFGALISVNEAPHEQPQSLKEETKEQVQEAMSGIKISISSRRHIDFFNQFTDAIEQDPTIADAYVGRGSLYLRWIDRMPTLRSETEKQSLGTADVTQLRSLAIADYQRARDLFKEQGDLQRQKQLTEAISCIPTGGDCQIYYF